MNNVSHVATTDLPAVESALVHALDVVVGSEAPAPLAAAIRHAVLGGGSRFRPRLLLAVAASVGVHDEKFAMHAAAAVELLHAASLVHDDLPAFDDASMRRGMPSVHARYGEALAILAGDALIVGAYEILHAGVSHHPRCHQAMRILFRAGGAAEGLAKGQALELLPCESNEALERYQRSKTGVLFEAAAALGALAADVDPAPWLPVARELGRLYQILDDVLDVCGDPARAGKELGNDARHGRPTSVEPPGSGPRLVAENARDMLQPGIERLRNAVPTDAPILAAYIEEMLAETTSRLR